MPFALCGAFSCFHLLVQLFALSIIKRAKAIIKDKVLLSCSQHFATAAPLNLLLSMHRVHVSAGATITRHCLPSMYIFGRIHLCDVHIAVKWWLFSHYFVYFLD
jgi:hypothetical protein